MNRAKGDSRRRSPLGDGSAIPALFGGTLFRTTSGVGLCAACAEDGQATGCAQPTAVSVAGRETKDLAKQYEAHVRACRWLGGAEGSLFLPLLFGRPRMSLRAH